MQETYHGSYAQLRAYAINAAKAFQRIVLEIQRGILSNHLRLIKNVSARTYLNTPLNIRIPRKGPATEVREVMGWCWVALAAQSEA